MVARKHTYGGLVFVLAACLGTVYVFTRSPVKPVEMFSQADLNIIDTAENRDATPQGLAMKNDDGHTHLWNAEATKKHSIVVKSARGQRQLVDVDNYGMPRFYVHATGWVNDVGAGSKSGALASHGTTSLMSKQSIKDIEKWETAMLRTSYPDADANPKQAALAASHEARLARGLKKMAQLAQTQKLWNAAGNDEITASNIGHVHPSEMSELQRMSPEYHQTEAHAHVTSATQMSFHPLKWMQQERAPAVKSHTARTSKLAQTTNTVAKKAARLQQLWNAGADDEVGGNPNLDAHGNPEVEYHPMKWISDQRDPSELGSSYAPREHNGRVFQEHRNHVRNYEGSYVNDNSIGIKVDALKGRVTMLAELPTAKKTTLEEAPAADAPATEEVHDENEETIKMLDELRNQAMSAFDSMPEGTPEIMKHMVKADYEKVMQELDVLRAQAMGQDNGEPAPAAAAKSGSTVLASVNRIGLTKVALALKAGVGKPLSQLKESLKQLDSANAAHDGQRQALVARALSDACDTAVEILAEPKYARFLANQAAVAA